MAIVLTFPDPVPAGTGSPAPLGTVIGYGTSAPLASLTLSQDPALATTVPIPTPVNPGQTLTVTLTPPEEYVTSLTSRGCPTAITATTRPRGC